MVMLLAGIVVQLAMIATFGTAVAQPKPHHVPVALVGDVPAARQLWQEAHSSGAFDVHIEPSEDIARQAIADRDVYGAFLFDRPDETVLVAGAASPAVSQLLTGLANRQAAISHRPVIVEDVKPLPKHDPRGAVVMFTVLAWTIGGYLSAMLVGRVIGLRSPSLRQVGLRLAILAGYSVVAGALTLLLAQSVMGVVTGGYLALASLGALMVFAVGCFTSVLQSLFGPAGTFTAVALLVLFGNPAGGSGQLAPEMLPRFWRDASYFLPNPAAMRAFHGIESFSGRGIGIDMTVLAVYAVASIGLMLVMLSRHPVPAVPRAAVPSTVVAPEIAP
jgi:hypothetical protein